MGEIQISEEKFKERFGQLIYATKVQFEEGVSPFRKGIWANEENYKHIVAERARQALDTDSWDLANPEHILKGIRESLVVLSCEENKVLEKSKKEDIQNFVSKSERDKLWIAFYDKSIQFATVFFQMYKGQPLKMRFRMSKHLIL